MYRFRSIESLLGKYKELERQEVYFASPGELNDPMEGLKDVFWDGDEIVWKNLIINYTKSLERIFSIYILIKDDKEITYDDIMVSHDLMISFSPQQELLIRDIVNKLFDFEYIKEMPLDFSKRKSPIRRAELLSRFQIIHLFALNSISEVYLKNGLTNKLIFHNDLDEFELILKESDKLSELVNNFENETNKNITESFFGVVSNYIKSITLSSKLSYSEIKPNSFLLISEFPNKFFSKLENEIYPPWYSASFLGNNKNSALWGHYGDCHKGVCLKFKTTIEDSNLVLNLEKEYGYNGSPMIGMRPFTFRKIEYHNKHVEIDFFRSMGRLTKLELNKLWYSDLEGNVSPCGSHLDSTEKEDKWRDSYWNNFDNSLIIKLKEWEYENEYRLVIQGDFINYSKTENRKLRYDFADLESITFGIKTDNISKLKIMKIIERKCIDNNRNDFEFYQAYYSKNSGQIESSKI